METASTLLLVMLSLIVHVSIADKPSELSQGVFCEGCVATVKEMLKKLEKKTGDIREVKVIDAMEDICNLQNFGSYDYSPPKTGKACKYLIENYDEDIENIFVAETEDLEQKICYELTKACVGVDRSKKEKEELEVKVNDRKQPLHQRPASSEDKEATSGPQTLNVNINEEGAADKLISQITNAIKNKKTNEIKEDEEDDDDDNEDDDNEDDGEENENLTDNMNEEKTEL